MFLAAALWGLDLAGAGFFGVAALVGYGAAWLVRRPQRAWKVVAVVLGVAVAAAAFFAVFGLAEPAAFFDFVPGVLMLVGFLLALVAGIAAIRAATSGTRRPGHPAERRVMAGALVVVVVLTAVSGALTLGGRETVSEADRASADLVVDLHDFAFDEDAYDVAPGETILVTNSDPFLHTFTVEELDIDVELTPGSEQLVTVPDEGGSFVLYCRPHTADAEDPADDDMAAELTVG